MIVLPVNTCGRGKEWRLMIEMFGKERTWAQGKEGSIHLFDSTQIWQ